MVALLVILTILAIKVYRLQTTHNVRDDINIADLIVITIDDLWQIEYIIIPSVVCDNRCSLIGFFF